MSGSRTSGTIKYAMDAAVDGMWHARILRSPFAHARIKRIDVSLVPDGVVVLTGEDTRDLNHYGCQIADETVLAQGEVRFAGDPVAAVAARTRREADEALVCIEVDYEELPAVFGAEAAVAPGAHLVHAQHNVSENDAAYFGIRPINGTNVCHKFQIRHGDIEAGFAEADVIVEETYRTDSAAHVPMEPHATLAWWEGDRLEIITGSQTPFNVRMDLAIIFGIDQEKVRVKCPPMGGSFGAKTFIRLEGIVAALARKAGRPVKMVLDRSEEWQTLNRHPATITVRIGAKKDGTLVAKKVTCLADTGAYADCGPGVAQKMGFASPGPYRIPNVWVDSSCVYTNTPPNGAYRGYGQMQSIWASERTMDLLADRLGIDPLTLRMQNLLREGDAYCTGEVMHDLQLEQCLAAAANAIGWHEGRKGKGLSLLIKGMQTPSRASIMLKHNGNGSYHIECATAEMGQGAHLAIRTMAAGMLGIDVRHVSISYPDTAISPYDTRTTSSRSTHMMSRALAEALKDLRLNGIDVGIGEVRDEGGLNPDTGQGIASSHWHQGAAGAIVELDDETGLVKVKHLHASVYAGKVVVRKAAEMQNEGSMIMGFGTAMFERIEIADGQVTNANLSDYSVPSIADLPKMTHDLIEVEGALVHGLGETALPPIPPAIGNALQTFGVRMTTLPMTPERVLAAIDLRDGRVA
ncbi:MAG: xanthine dehydrogenase family protein molybdopterin-binding subunit [Devosia sp.]